jgi:hypothetical protein
MIDLYTENRIECSWIFYAYVNMYTHGCRSNVWITRDIDGQFMSEAVTIAMKDIDAALTLTGESMYIRLYIYLYLFVRYSMYPSRHKYTYLRFTCGEISKV